MCGDNIAHILFTSVHVIDKNYLLLKIHYSPSLFLLSYLLCFYVVIKLYSNGKHLMLRLMKFIIVMK